MERAAIGERFGAVRGGRAIRYEVVEVVARESERQIYALSLTGKQRRGRRFTRTFTEGEFLRRYAREQ